MHVDDDVQTSMVPCCGHGTAPPFEHSHHRSQPVDLDDDDYDDRETATSDAQASAASSSSPSTHPLASPLPGTNTQLLDYIKNRSRLKVADDKSFHTYKPHMSHYVFPIESCLRSDNVWVLKISNHDDDTVVEVTPPSQYELFEATVLQPSKALNIAPVEVASSPLKKRPREDVNTKDLPAAKRARPSPKLPTTVCLTCGKKYSKIGSHFISASKTESECGSALTYLVLDENGQPGGKVCVWKSKA